MPGKLGNQKCTVKKSCVVESVCTADNKMYIGCEWTVVSVFYAGEIHSGSETCYINKGG